MNVGERILSLALSCHSLDLEYEIGTLDPNCYSLATLIVYLPDLLFKERGYDYVVKGLEAKITAEYGDGGYWDVRVYSPDGKIDHPWLTYTGETMCLGDHTTTIYNLLRDEQFDSALRVLLSALRAESDRPAGAQGICTVCERSWYPHERTNRCARPGCEELIVEHNTRRRSERFYCIEVAKCISCNELWCANHRITCNYCGNAVCKECSVESHCPECFRERESIIKRSKEVSGVLSTIRSYMYNTPSYPLMMYRYTDHLYRLYSSASLWKGDPDASDELVWSYVRGLNVMVNSRGTEEGDQLRRDIIFLLYGEEIE